MDNTITINGIKYEFNPGETILEVARRNGIAIPTLCYLKGASPTGSCRICVVEVKGAPGPIASCSSPAAPNMEVMTETPRIVRARKMVIELLLISGNHNCAVRGSLAGEWSDFQQEVIEYDQAEDICIAYGSCELQALAYKYQVTQRVLDRIPTKYPLEYNDPLIGRDFGRCILCGRCVQACCDIQVNNALSHGYRGNIAKIVVRGDRTLPDSDCVYCGECVQSCPVGALFEKRNRFNYRMWDVGQVRTTCHYCGVGCQLDLHIKDNNIVKVDGVEDISPNLGRLCFKGRFGFDFIHSRQRLKKPMVRQNGKLVETTWEKALNLIAAKIKEIREHYGNDSLGCCVSTKITNEDLLLARKFFKDVLSSDQIFHVEAPAYLGIDYQYLFQAKNIVMVEFDITRDNPVAATFIKQAVLKGVQLITVNCQGLEIDKFAHVRLEDLAGLKDKIEGETVLFHRPGIDVSAIRQLTNLTVCSISRENNTMGAYFLGIKPRSGRNFKDMKFMYTMNPGFSIPDSLEFLVVQDIFSSGQLEKADVVLPASVWVEYEGTYLGSDFRVNLVNKAVEAPGEARPPWWIFRELAEKMGQHWSRATVGEIWNADMRKLSPFLESTSYETLANQDIRVEQPDDLFLQEKIEIPVGLKGSVIHRILIEHCQDLQTLVSKRFGEAD